MTASISASSGLLLLSQAGSSPSIACPLPCAAPEPCGAPPAPVLAGLPPGVGDPPYDELAELTSCGCACCWADWNRGNESMTDWGAQGCAVGGWASVQVQQAEGGRGRGGGEVGQREAWRGREVRARGEGTQGGSPAGRRRERSDSCSARQGTSLMPSGARYRRQTSRKALTRGKTPLPRPAVTTRAGAPRPMPPFTPWCASVGGHECGLARADGP